jgi:predicted  nucleic acid-binding Zn-ribbon protein
MAVSCEICGKTVKTPQALVGHVRFSHPEHFKPKSKRREKLLEKMVPAPEYTPMEPSSLRGMLYDILLFNLIRDLQRDRELYPYVQRQGPDFSEYSRALGSLYDKIVELTKMIAETRAETPKSRVEEDVGLADILRVFTEHEKAVLDSAEKKAERLELAEEERKRELEEYKRQISQIQAAIYDLEKKRLEEEKKRLEREIEEARRRQAVDRETAVVQAQENITTKAIEKIGEAIDRVDRRIEDALNPLAKAFIEDRRHQRWMDRVYYSHLLGTTPERLQEQYERDHVPEVSDEELLASIEEDGSGSKEEPALATKGPWKPKEEEEGDGRSPVGSKVEAEKSTGDGE